MEENNLEITKEIDNLNAIPTEEKINNEEAIQEVEDINEQIEMVEETIAGIDKLTDDIKDVKQKKKLKDKIKDKWNSFSKKKKIIIIVVSIIIVLLIALGIFFAIKHFSKDEQEKKVVEDVIFEADNYRYENGFLILLDAKDKELGKYECENKDEELCYVAYYEIDENIDEPKKIDEDGKILNVRSDIILEKYVFIHDAKNVKSENVNLYDIKSNEVIESYNSVKSIKDKYAVVKDATKSYGLIEFSEEESKVKFEFNYDNIALLNDNDKKLIIVNENGRNFLVDENEKSKSKAISMEIVNYNDKYLVAKDEGDGYYLYDYNNKLIYDDTFEYIKVLDKSIIFVKDGKIFATTTDNEKLNEVGYDVKNKYKYYQKLYIYDKDNKLSETYEAFAAVDNGNSITLTIDEKDYIINKIEGKISATISYVNYFDGILYFYDNEDKTNSIGEYKCTNKNNLLDNSTTFENCFVASDNGSSDNDMTNSSSTGVIPIIDSRYVFIKDNPNAVSESNTNIVLYDLKQKKAISKYVSVNTNLNTNADKPGLIPKTKLYVIAKNKSNKYGVILIEDEVSSIISFNNNSIEKIGLNYLVSDSNGYSLYDTTGKELTKKVSNKIRGYNSNYLKVLENNSYQIYDYTGQKITTTGFKYIELYDNYFAGVDSSNKLNMYSYNEPNKSLIENSIQLSSDNYYKEGNLAFKITIIGTNANISVLNGGSYTSTVYFLIPNVVIPSAPTENEVGDEE